MSPRPRPDFVQVRLSTQGRTFAQGGALRIHTAHLRYAFEGDTAVEVLKFAEWPTLRRECDAEGNPLFELAETAAQPVMLPATEAQEESDAGRV